MKRAARLLAACLASAGVFCLVSYAGDRAFLGTVARTVAGAVPEPSRQVLSLLNWLDERPGTARNGGYFLVPGWRATPRQVLDGGGDCADRSRLLVAMLGTLDIPATMVMCFDSRTGAPAHTIVEATVEDGRRMVVDPIYNLYFPRAGGDGFYDLSDLRNDAGIVPRRVGVLLAERPGEDPYYLSSPAAYHTASTFNWGKNGVTQWLAAFGERALADDWFRLSRPSVIEEPKLMAASFLLAGAVGIALLPGLASLVALLLVRRRAHRAERRKGIVVGCSPS